MKEHDPVHRYGGGEIGHCSVVGLRFDAVELQGAPCLKRSAGVHGTMS